MKVYLNVILLILLISCNHSPERVAGKKSTDNTIKNTPPLKSMKGFDLYAWEKDGIILFTLLPGTNREKTSEEIYDRTNAVEGMSAIEHTINGIDSGEYIFLKPIQIDTIQLEPLITYMRGRNLKVSVIPQK